MKPRRTHSPIRAMAILLVAQGLVMGANFLVGWDHNPVPPSPGNGFTVGYRVYWGPTSRTNTGFPAYKFAGDAGYTNRFAISNLPAGPWFFAATAYSSDGLESDYSDEVMAMATGLVRVVNLRITP